MRIVSMSGSLRENVGKKDAKALRNSGKVPCVLYGGKEQIHFSMDVKQFKDLIYSPHIAFVSLEIEGKKYDAILQDASFHVVSDNLMHADFMELHQDRAIIMRVPVKTKGNSPGVIKGGILAVKINKLKVKALPANMPEVITVDISKLEIGNSVKVKEVETDNFSLLDQPNSVVCTIKVTRAAAAAAQAATTGKK